MRQPRAILAAVLCVSSFLLAACPGRYSHQPGSAAPPAPNPIVCLPAKPEPEIRGSIVAPVTAEEREATGLFLSSVAALADWGRQMAVRAEAARQAC